MTEAHEGESEVEFAERLENQLEQLIVANDPESIATFIAEPVMGVGGVILPLKTYFVNVQSILRQVR